MSQPQSGGSWESVVGSTSRLPAAPEGRPLGTSSASLGLLDRAQEGGIDGSNLWHCGCIVLCVSILLKANRAVLYLELRERHEKTADQESVFVEVGRRRQ